MKRVAHLLLVFLFFNFQEYQKSVVVLEDGRNRVVYQQSELDRITKIFPELLPFPQPLSPDEAYDRRGTDYVSTEKDMDIVMGFNSEAGQDKFYILYAYFLKKKNGIEPYQEIRENLITIYQLINQLNRFLYVGGTFYAHQHYRIYGYAEYAIYSMTQPNAQRERGVSITEAKASFMGDLEEMMMDEITLDESISESEKAIRKKKTGQMLGELNRLISSSFYLASAEEFQNRYY